MFLFARFFKHQPNTPSHWTLYFNSYSPGGLNEICDHQIFIKFLHCRLHTGTFIFNMYKSTIIANHSSPRQAGRMSGSSRAGTEKGCVLQNTDRRYENSLFSSDDRQKHTCFKPNLSSIACAENLEVEMEETTSIAGAEKFAGKCHCVMMYPGDASLSFVVVFGRPLLTISFLSAKLYWYYQSIALFNRGGKSIVSSWI